MCKAKFLNPFKMDPLLRLAKKHDPVTKALLKKDPVTKAISNIGENNSNQSQNAVLGQGTQTQANTYLGSPKRTLL